MGQGEVVAGKWRQMYLNNNKKNFFKHINNYYLTGLWVRNLYIAKPHPLRRQSRCQPRQELIWRPNWRWPCFQAPPCYWESSSPCSCRTGIPAFSLTISQGLLLVFRGNPQFFATWPSPYALHNMVAYFFKTRKL